MYASPEVERIVCPRNAHSESPSAVVVGAGVSGCACAAVLACKGVRVTVLNSVLDAVGLPAYGPEVKVGAGGWAEIGETMAALPAALRGVWLNAASVPDNGAPFLVVDRRAVSIETKRALERIPGLQFRQGLVTDVRVLPAEGEWSGLPVPGRLAVETVFGEVLEADAVVLAVGLGLGGRVTAGADALPGGRYGEIPADGLRKALGAMGVNFREVTMEVGARFSSRSPSPVDGSGASWSGYSARATVMVRWILGESREKWPAGRWSELEQVRQALQSGPARAGRDGRDGGDGGGGDESASGGAGSSEWWPDSHPPAVHWTEGLCAGQIVLRETGGGVQVPLLSPDGAATAEFYLSPEGARIGGLQIEEPCGSVLGMEMPASRLGHTVRALVMTSITPGGRLTLESGEPWIWAAGRAGGAADYLESLRSGARVGEEVAEELAGRRFEDPKGYPRVDGAIG